MPTTKSQNGKGKACLFQYSKPKDTVTTFWKPLGKIRNCWYWLPLTPRYHFINFVNFKQKEKFMVRVGVFTANVFISIYFMHFTGDWGSNIESSNAVRQLTTIIYNLCIMPFCTFIQSTITNTAHQGVSPELSFPKTVIKIYRLRILLPHLHGDCQCKRIPEYYMCTHSFRHSL